MDMLDEHFYKRNISQLNEEIFHKSQRVKLAKKKLNLLKKEYKSYLMEEKYLIIKIN